MSEESDEHRSNGDREEEEAGKGKENNDGWLKTLLRVVFDWFT